LSGREGGKKRGRERGIEPVIVETKIGGGGESVEWRARKLGIRQRGRVRGGKGGNQSEQNETTHDIESPAEGKGLSNIGHALPQTTEGLKRTQKKKTTFGEKEGNG